MHCVHKRSEAQKRKTFISKSSFGFHLSEIAQEYNTIHDFILLLYHFVSKITLISINCFDENAYVYFVKNEECFEYIYKNIRNNEKKNKSMINSIGINVEH